MKVLNQPQISFFSTIFFILILINSLSLLGQVNEFDFKTESSIEYDYTRHFSFQAQINPNLYNTQSIINGTFEYAFKMQDYWLSLLASYKNASINKMTVNNSTATKVSDDQFGQAKAGSLFNIGIGISLETELSKNLFLSNNVYEKSSAYLTYSNLKSFNQDFMGIGFVTSFSLYYKLSSFFSIGPIFTYELHSVKRKQDNDAETSSHRSLTLSFITTGIDFSVNF